MSRVGIESISSRILVATLKHAAGYCHVGTISQDRVCDKGFWQTMHTEELFPAIESNSMGMCTLCAGGLYVAFRRAGCPGIRHVEFFGQSARLKKLGLSGGQPGKLCKL